MNDYGAPPSGLNLYIEVFVAVMIMMFFVIGSLTTLRKRHRDTDAWHVHLGAAIYGAVFGLVMGFGIVPLRMYMTQGDLPPQMAGYVGIAILALVIALRRGLIGRLPFLGPQVKAYRRASLRRAIEASQKQLDALAPKAKTLGNES